MSAPAAASVAAARAAAVPERRPTSAWRRGPVPALVRAHVGLGETALRLFLLHLLWVLGVLAGGVLLGLAPATAAVHTVLRDDARAAARERAGEDPGPVPRLWAHFWSAWRGEFGRATALGAVLVLGWGVILVDRWVLLPGIGEATPWLSGAVVVLTVALALLTLAVWPVAAHFADPLPRILRMTLVLLLRRPVLTLGLVLLALGSLAVIQTVPGLAPVFGIVLPAWLVTQLCWRSGVFPTD